MTNLTVRPITVAPGVRERLAEHMATMARVTEPAPVAPGHGDHVLFRKDADTLATGRISRLWSKPAGNPYVTITADGTGSTYVRFAREVTRLIQDNAVIQFTRADGLVITAVVNHARANGYLSVTALPPLSATTYAVEASRVTVISD